MEITTQTLATNVSGFPIASLRVLPSGDAALWHCEPSSLRWSFSNWFDTVEEAESYFQSTFKNQILESWGDIRNQPAEVPWVKGDFRDL